MTIKIQGDKITFPDDSEQTTAYDGSSGGGVPEAPIDGKEYARKDAEWVEVTGGDAVVFRGELLANQTVAGSTMTKVNLDTSSIDTDSALVDGKFKPSVAGYYQVNGAVGAYCVPPSDNTNVTLFKNGVVYSSGSQISMVGLNSARSVVSDVIYLNGTTDYLELHGFVTSTGTTAIDSSDANTFLSAVLVTGGTGTGGSGGGSYTPEPMVWEDKSADKEPSVKYTNTNNVPLYVSLRSYANIADTGNYFTFKMDDFEIGGSGSQKAIAWNTNLFIVPAGSTYEVILSGTCQITRWMEASMPVAVGTGGKTVAFRAKLSSDQTGFSSSTWGKVNLDTAPIDTDNALIDGKFQPSVAGYYQVSGTARQQCTPPATQIVTGIYKNGVITVAGSEVTTTLESARSIASGLIYLDGKEDYIELYVLLGGSGSLAINSSIHNTNLSAVLVSGGSGGSIWTEEDGKAVYDGDIEVNGVTVGTGNGNNQNAILGDGAGSSLTTGFNDTALGYYALNNATDGNNNTAIGTTAGSTLTTGSNVTCIGYSAQPSSPDKNNQVNIGNDAVEETRLAGRVQFRSYPDIGTSPSAPNMFISVSGHVYQSTAVFYSTQEVDKMLAIKDKLIEKLSARLDAIEKKVK